MKNGMENVRELSLDKLQPSKLNPRKYYDEEKLKELAESIKVKGVVCPILVRPLRLEDSAGKDEAVRAAIYPAGEFEIVYGERRFRACKLIELKTIPAFVKPLADAEVLELQVIENLQRDDLNSIEEAQGFKALLEQCKYTQEKLAGKIGKSQGYIAARLALLNLSKDYQKDVASGKLLPGHVKYLMSISDRPKILKAIRKDMGNHKEQLTVRAFASIVQTVLSRRTKQLTGNSYGGPEFDTKDCNNCEFKRTIQLFYGSPEKRCVNTDCYNKKQRLARKAARERVKSKIAKGKVVDEKTLKDVKRFDNYECKFDKKSCNRCAKKKVMIIKERWSDLKKIEVCTDKACFERKNVLAVQEEKRKEAQVLQDKIKKVKTKAANAKMDREFWASVLTVEMCNSHGGLSYQMNVVLDAYDINEKKCKSRKAAREYFTSNKQLDLEEIFRFITYWGS